MMREWSFTAEDAAIFALHEAVWPAVQGNPGLQAFCGRPCYERYLKASAWNVHKAYRALQATLKWRASYKPEQLRWEHVAPEAGCGKLCVVQGADLEGRPVVLMRPRNEASTSAEARLRCLVYTMEQACRIADEGEGGMSWLVDCGGFRRQHSGALKLALEVLHILQHHYPERLVKVVLYKPPVVLDMLWRAVSAFLDPATRSKVVLLNAKAAAAGQLAEHFALEKLDESLGGAVPLAQAYSMAALRERCCAADSTADRLLLEGTPVMRGLWAAAAAEAAAEADEEAGEECVGGGEGWCLETGPSEEVLGSRLGELLIGAAAAASAGGLGGWEQGAGPCIEEGSSGCMSLAGSMSIGSWSSGGLESRGESAACSPTGEMVAGQQGFGGVGAAGTAAAAAVTTALAPLGC